MIPQHQKYGLGSFGLIGDYTDVAGVQVTGDDGASQRRTAMQRLRDAAAGVFTKRSAL
jgi:hypothetical protein